MGKYRDYQAAACMHAANIMQVSKCVIWISCILCDDLSPKKGDIAKRCSLSRISMRMARAMLGRVVAAEEVTVLRCGCRRQVSPFVCR